MKRKRIIIAGIIIIMTTTGCSNASETTDNATVEILQLPYNTPEVQPAENENPSTDILPENDSNPDADHSQKLNLGDPDAVFIGGKVRSISQGQFVISRTLVEDFIVTMPEPGSPDEVLVTVRCLESTVYEHWTIQGGGAGITRKEAAFSDIKVGDGLEASGSFDGEEFIADKVIIELYE